MMIKIYNEQYQSSYKKQYKRLKNSTIIAIKTPNSFDFGVFIAI